MRLRQCEDGVQRLHHLGRVDNEVGVVQVDRLVRVQCAGDEVGRTSAGGRSEAPPAAAEADGDAEAAEAAEAFAAVVERAGG